MSTDDRKKYVHEPEDAAIIIAQRDLAVAALTAILQATIGKDRISAQAVRRIARNALQRATS